MPRLTRAERQAQTRSDLIKAAKTRFLDHGYAATSLDDVADAAGYSKGAVYSNFQDKRHLCRAVLDAIHHDKLSEIEAITTADIEMDQRLDALSIWIDNAAGDVGWTMLEMEFTVLSRNDPELAAMIVTLRSDVHVMIIAVLRSFLSGLGFAATDTSPLPMSLESIANLLLSTAIGLGIQRAVDPSVSVEPATEVATGLFTILASLAPSHESDN